MQDVVTENLEPSKLQEYLSQLGDWAVNKCFELAIAIIFLFIGVKLVRAIVKMIHKSFAKSNMEDSVESFLLSLIRFVLYAILVIAAASIVKIQVTSLVTILGTASLAIGLALQGSLANFAGGVLILLLKPFRVGDYIIENDKGCEGTVTSIDIFYTKLTTYDKKVIVIPNGNITANSLINVTAAGERRLEVFVSVAYDTDIRKTKDVLMEIVKANAKCESDRDVDVFVDSFQDSAIKMGLRCYVKSEDYWPAKWELQETIKEEFDKHHIVIPFQQMEISVKQDG
ncbi:MAG: mechanosensitive ion channel family protein [Wujia sp.]